MFRFFFFLFFSFCTTHAHWVEKDFSCLTKDATTGTSFAPRMAKDDSFLPRPQQPSVGRPGHTEGAAAASSASSRGATGAGRSVAPSAKPDTPKQVKFADDGGKDSAKNVAQKERYKEQLKQEQRIGDQSGKAVEQLAEMKSARIEDLNKIAGAGCKKPIADEPRLISTYGGQPGDWAKIKSSNHKLQTGETLETHAYVNIKTGEIVEPKTKIQ